VTDVLSPEQRRFNMSRVRGQDTKPEMQIRRGLHARGLRYRLQGRDLPGRPDLVFPKYRVVIFVHGCFWHFHGCGLSKVPKTREEFWTKKLLKNQARDRQSSSQLQAAGWRVLWIWECALRGNARLDSDDIFAVTERFIRDGRTSFLEIGSSRAV